MISEYKSNQREYGYNVTEGGDAPQMPKEVRQILSEKLKGNKNGLGKPCSEEKRRKISEANKGHKFSEEHRRRISEVKKGKSHKPISLEARKKIADAHKKKAVFCEETQKDYESIQECARQLQVDATAICACLHGRHKHHKGYHFRYTENKGE